MARTNLATVETGEPWAQPARVISVPVGKNGRGHFVPVPMVDWLGTIAETHGHGAAGVALDAVADYMASEAKAAVNKKDVTDKNSADTEREIINGVVSKIANGTYDSGDISGRDDFNRALLAKARETLRSALAARGEVNPTDARVAEAFKANYARAMERFGNEVVSAGYTPSTKTKGGRQDGAATDVADLPF